MYLIISHVVSLQIRVCCSLSFQGANDRPSSCSSSGCSISAPASTAGCHELAIWDLQRKAVKTKGP